MKIGSGWTKTTDDNKTFISVALDETVLELYPQLKELNISLGFADKSERKKENSPGWNVNITKRKEKVKEEKEEPNKINDEEIPF